MWHLIRLGIHFRWLTILIAIMLTGAAVWGTLQLKTEMIPNIEFPFTGVITVYPDLRDRVESTYPRHRQADSLLSLLLLNMAPIWVIRIEL